MTAQATSPTQLFHDLNKQFFGGRLPRYRVTLSSSALLDGECLSGQRLIRLRRGPADRPLREILLHEMCHIGTGNGHGEKFLARLRGLAAQGEAWATDEADGYAAHLTWNGAMAELKERLEIFWVDRRPRPRFATVLRREARLLRLRPGELRRAAPWLPAAWRNACQMAERVKKEGRR